MVTAELSAYIGTDEDPSEERLLEIVASQSGPWAMAWSSFLDKLSGTERLVELVLNGSQVLRELAWRRLVKSGVSNAQLLDIIDHVDSLRGHAFELFLKQSPTKRDLLSLVWGDTGNIPRKAWQEVRSRYVLSGNDLCRVIQFSPRFRDTAWDLLLATPPTEKQLITILQADCGFERRVFRLLQAQGISNYQLRQMVRNYPSIKQDAAKLLLEQNPSPDELRVIIMSGCYSKQAGLRLLANNPSLEDLQFLNKHCKAVRSEARERLGIMPR